MANRPTMEEIRLRLRPQDILTVCNRCLRTSCWLGEYMCDRWPEAGTREITVSEARRLNREHPDCWRELRVAEGYNDAQEESDADGQ